MGSDLCPLCLSTNYGIGAERKISSLLELFESGDDHVHGDDNEALVFCPHCDNLLESATTISNSISQLQLNLRTEIAHIRTIILASEPNFEESGSNLSEKIVIVRKSFLGAEEQTLSEEVVIKTEVDGMDNLDDRPCLEKFSKIRKRAQKHSGQQDKSNGFKREVEEDGQNLDFSFLLEPESSDEMKMAKSGLKTEDSDEVSTSDSEWILPEADPKRRKIGDDISISVSPPINQIINENSQVEMPKVAKISTRVRAYTPRAKNPEIMKGWKTNSEVLDKEIKVLKRKRKTGSEFKIYLCPLCNHEFEKTLNLVVHLLDEHETEEKLFSCSKCEKKYTQKLNLQRHVELHGYDEEKPVVCEHCENRFEDKATLELHISSTHVKSHACPLCPQTFTRHGSLMRHRRAVHNEAGGFKFSCDKPGCGATFKYKETLQSHYIKMHRKDPVTCDQCGSQFVHRKGLQAHIKSAHEGIKNFKCEVCRTSFSAKTSLQNHMTSVHSTERPFICSFCGNAFKLIRNLKAHEQSVHSKKYVRNLKYRCPHCPNKYEYKHILEGHIRQAHTGERPFVCHFLNCGLAYAQRNILTEHLRKSHGIIGKVFDRGPRSKRDVFPQRTKDNVSKQSQNKSKSKQTKKSEQRV